MTAAASLPVDVVVDASVAIKWLLVETNSPEALKLLAGTTILHAPDLLLPEVGNILWKRVRSGEISAEKAKELLDWLSKLPILLYPSQPLMLAAVEIACQYDRTVYDSLYIALTVQKGCVLVTADEKLRNAFTGTALDSHLVLVQTL
ncbi:MAG TPA: type II toxin-antitoxin system VapC family toxin [Chthonomonadaceae bacterium]|nr:type II toxin-antitoxin system VapC family toxin [Chthonomonadaceae bacterium]